MGLGVTSYFDLRAFTAADLRSIGAVEWPTIALRMAFRSYELADVAPR